MAHRFVTASAARGPWFGHAWRTVAAIASAGAAVASLISALYSYGIVGRAESHRTIGSLGAAWVALQPNADTARAIGDTLHLATTITDRAGSVLVGVQPTWTSNDPTVAMTLADGAVIAKGAGATTIEVAVGSLVARARIVVAPAVASVEIEPGSGDSTVTLSEGGRLPLRAIGRDARGHPVHGLVVGWHIDDTTVATIDSTGVLHGQAPGQSVVTASARGVVGHAPVSVAATPAAIAIVAGSAQRTTAGSPLPQPVVVRLTSRRGLPVAGQLVTFRPADGRGVASPDTARTDADGRARTTWTLGSRPGPQRLLVSAAHLDSAATISADAEPSATGTRVAAFADTVSGVAGTVVADTLGVRVTDTTGRALGGVAVSWTALDGSVRPLDGRTDSLGRARARWTLGGRAGLQRVSVQVGRADGAAALAPITIAATATAGVPDSVIVVAGDAQQATVGAALARPILLRVLDRHGNRVPNATLVFAPSGGTVANANARTNAGGTAAVHWTLGRSAGRLTMAVHADGVKRLVRVRARAVPAAPANLAFDNVPSTRTSRARRLVALVTDVYGNPVPNVGLRFTTRYGTVSPSRAVTDNRGRVALSWIAIGQPRELTLTGVVRGTDVTGRYIVTRSADAGTASHHWGG